jgi:hypothetical protein
VQGAGVGAVVRAGAADLLGRGAGKGGGSGHEAIFVHCVTP